jgi:hypothetical protein
MVFFVILNKTVLRKAAQFFSRDGELLFIGTMAYGLGAAGLCALAGASPMMGAYLAGLSLSFLPFQAQILEKIASLKVRLRDGEGGGACDCRAASAPATAALRLLSLCPPDNPSPASLPPPCARGGSALTGGHGGIRARWRRG